MSRLVSYLSSRLSSRLVSRLIRSHALVPSSNDSKLYISYLALALCNLVSSLVSSPLELSLLLLALSISSLLKLLSADCGQFTDLPGSLCVVLKNTGCAFLTSRIVSRVFHRVISRCDCCSALCSLLCSASNCSASAARLRSRIAALFGSQLCLAGSRLFLAHGSARLDVAAALLAASALLCLRLLAAPPLARRGFSRLAALLGPCDSVTVWHDWLGSRLPAQLGSGHQSAWPTAALAYVGRLLALLV